jgi:hypothetical protein
MLNINKSALKGNKNVNSSSKSKKFMLVLLVCSLLLSSAACSNNSEESVSDIELNVNSEQISEIRAEDLNAFKVFLDQFYTKYNSLNELRTSDINRICNYLSTIEYKMNTSTMSNQDVIEAINKAYEIIKGVDVNKEGLTKDTDVELSLEELQEIINRMYKMINVEYVDDGNTSGGVEGGEQAIIENPFLGDYVPTTEMGKFVVQNTLVGGGEDLRITAQLKGDYRYLNPTLGDEESENAFYKTELGTYLLFRDYMNTPIGVCANPNVMKYITKNGALYSYEVPDILNDLERQMTFVNQAVAGVDYTITCDTDPDAIELKHGIPTAEAGIGMVKSVDRYVFTKTGYFDCTITYVHSGLSEKVTLHILKLDNKYDVDDYPWAKNEEEFNALVRAFSAFSSYLYDEVKSRVTLIGMNTDLTGITDTYGNKFDILNTEEGNLYWRYLKSIIRLSVDYSNSSKSTEFLDYDAFEGMFGTGGMCNTDAAVANAIASLSGIRSRHCAWWERQHAWTEFYVPASICSDGKEHWISVGQYNSPDNYDPEIVRVERKIFKEEPLFDWVK